MPGLVPGIHASRPTGKTWMAGTSPAMTTVASKSFLQRGLHRVLDLLELVEFDIEVPAADVLDAPDVDGLHDVARLRVDRDRAARAFPRHALGGRDQRLGVRLAAGFLQRLVDQVHAVIAADRQEVRVEAAIGI